MEDEVKLSLIIGQKEFEMIGSESEVKQKWEETKFQVPYQEIMFLDSLSRPPGLT